MLLLIANFQPQIKDTGNPASSAVKTNKYASSKWCAGSCRTLAVVTQKNQTHFILMLQDHYKSLNVELHRVGQYEAKVRSSIDIRNVSLLRFYQKTALIFTPNDILGLILRGVFSFFSLLAVHWKVSRESYACSFSTNC